MARSSAIGKRIVGIFLRGARSGRPPVDVLRFATALLKSAVVNNPPSNARRFTAGHAEVAVRPQGFPLSFSFVSRGYS
jgi:hypothetical protein